MSCTRGVVCFGPGGCQCKRQRAGLAAERRRIRRELLASVRAGRWQWTDAVVEAIKRATRGRR